MDRATDAQPGEPPFDLAWEQGGTIVVAEIKSLTPRNEERQLRLGLGQVLRHAQQLEAKGKPVTAVLAVESRPSDPSGMALCDRLALLWPAAFAARL